MVLVLEQPAFASTLGFAAGGALLTPDVERVCTDQAFSLHVGRAYQLEIEFYSEYARITKPKAMRCGLLALFVMIFAVSAETEVQPFQRALLDTQER